MHLSPYTDAETDTIATFPQYASTEFEGSPSPGQMQTVRLQAGALPAGTYFVRLSADGTTRTRRLTVLR